jgi:hypothetical protein
LSQFYKALIALSFLDLLPGQDLVDLPENGGSSASIQLWGHKRLSVNQARQANQGR